MIALRTTRPQEIAADNHRFTLEQWWNCKEYRQRSDAFLIDNPVCEYCGRSSETVHHDQDWMYHSKEAYFNPENFTATCNRCHKMHRKGLVICKICKAHYHARGRDGCKHCRPDKKPQRPRRPTRPYSMRQRHPCSRRLGLQKCQRQGRTYICPHSAKKAEGMCEHFMKRKVPPSQQGGRG